MLQKPKIIFSLFLFVSLFASGQQILSAEKQKEYDDSVKCAKLAEWQKDKEYIDWDFAAESPIGKLEKLRDEAIISGFFENDSDMTALSMMYLEYSSMFSTANIKMFDFNGDQKPDIYYYGPCGGNVNMTKLYIAKDDHFEKVFEGVQMISEYEFKENRLVSFTLFDPGCCLEMENINFYYIVKYSDDQPEFLRTHTIGAVKTAQKPDTLAEDYLSFSVATDSAALRNECYILDEIPCSPGNYSGTALAYYKKGSTGYLLGTRNEGGVEWVYVIMDVNPGKKHCFYPSFTEQPTQIKGWMLKSDSDLK